MGGLPLQYTFKYWQVLTVQVFAQKVTIVTCIQGITIIYWIIPVATINLVSKKVWLLSEGGYYTRAATKSL